MDNVRYNRIKAVLAEQDKTGTWLSEQMGRNIGTVSHWMTNKIQPSVEPLGSAAFIAKRRKNFSTSPSFVQAERHRARSIWPRRSQRYLSISMWM